MERKVTVGSGELGEDDLYEVMRHELREAAAEPDAPSQVQGPGEAG